QYSLFLEETFGHEKNNIAFLFYFSACIRAKQNAGIQLLWKGLLPVGGMSPRKIKLHLYFTHRNT
ncbi:MAG: hypothetical protein PVJ91_03885, partial [Flavobacteriaceae bacterium]